MDIKKYAKEIGELVTKDIIEMRKPKTSCEALKIAVENESDAVKMYEDLIHALDDEGHLTPELEHIIGNIIDQEAEHERYFKKLKDDLECHILMSYGRKITEYKPKKK